MEEAETVSIISRKELRKQKLMEYLAAKGKQKLPNPKPYLRDNCQFKTSAASALKGVEGKENKAPADTLRYTGTKDQTSAAQAAKHHARGAFGVTSKVNVKGRVPAGWQNAACPPATNRPAPPKLKQNPTGFTGTNAPNNASRNLKKRPGSGTQCSAGAATKIPASRRFTSSSSPLRSVPVKTSVRMSLGPIVKTKTGLIPAVTQPRNIKSHLTQASGSAADTTSATPAAVSQRSALVHRKTRPSAAPNNPAGDRTRVSSTAGVGVRSQDRKPLLAKYSQPSSKSLLPCGLKPVSTAKCTAAPVKPDGRGGSSKPSKSAGEPTDGSTKQKSSEAGGERNGKPSKAPSVASSGPASRCSFRAAAGAAVAEPGGQTKTRKDTQSRKGQSSMSYGPRPHAGTQRTGAPAMPQTVPQPARAVSRTGRATDAKTPKLPVSGVPQTEGKKVTAAQEERMKKLQEWREAKGISYKRPPMPVKLQVRRTVAVPQPFWTAMKEEDEAHSLISAIDRSLADCIKLLEEGCPPDQVKAVLSRLPALSQKFAKYWICRARLMEHEGNLDVLPMFEEAVRVVLEPVDELRTVVFEILKRRDEIQANEEKEDQIPTPESSPESGDNPMMTPKPVRAFIWGERGDSAVVKYKITATPGGPPSHQREPARVNGQEIRFFTPVRRSVRIERASLQYPASLQDHDLCVASYSDLVSREEREESERPEGGDTSPSVDDTPMYIYRQNEALKDKVFVQLVSDSGV